MTENMETANPSEKVSVVERILSAFVAAVSAEEGFEEISHRLQLKLIEEKDHTDDALEMALFGASHS
ncbi:hypothetical protein [Methylobacterium oryzae]|uniref:hypothetical protein n=1 Tax=Methylobacterium oryzae TaxID=334852 RepID=UPI002F35A6B2